MNTSGPGTAAYFPSVLARIREAHPDLPVDPVIVQSILLCLVAGGDDPAAEVASHGSKNLVLRTKEEDVSLVLGLTELVSLCHAKCYRFGWHQQIARPYSGGLDY